MTYEYVNGYYLSLLVPCPDNLYLLILSILLYKHPPLRVNVLHTRMNDFTKYIIAIFLKNVAVISL